MANNENLIPFNERPESERRAIRSAGGKKSGEVRRRKAAFKKTLNALLTAEIDSPQWKPFLESIGIECTLESAMLAAQIIEAMQGNTKAAYFVAQYAGQDASTDGDVRSREADIELKKARKQAITGENENDEAINKLDSILKEIRENAVKQQTE